MIREIDGKIIEIEQISKEREDKVRERLWMKDDYVRTYSDCTRLVKRVEEKKRILVKKHRETKRKR